MLATKTTYKSPRRSMKRRYKVITVPDKSLSPREIMDRFTRGLPMEIRKLDPVYLNHPDLDLEKISDLSNADRAEFAERMADDNKQHLRTLQANAEESKRAKQEKEAANKKEASQQKKGSGETSPDPDTGIERP